MIDMTQYAKAKSDQANAIDLGPTRPIWRIIGVEEHGGEQPISIHYEGGEGRPYKPCKSMIRVLIYIWGEDGSEYVGRSLEVYNDPEVTWGGEKVGGIRISRASHISEPMEIPLRVQGKKRILHRVDPLSTERPRKSLADHVDGYVAAVEAADTREALAAVTASEGANKVREAVKKAGDAQLLERMNSAGTKRLAELAPPLDEVEEPTEGQVREHEADGLDDDPFAEQRLEDD